MVYIGVIVKPQGIKGELKVKPADQNIQRYKSVKHLFLEEKETSVFSISAREGCLYVMLEGVKDRNAAELLRGKKLYVNKEELEELEENQYYFEDLIGCIVVDEQQTLIGQLEGIEQYGAADILRIRNSQNNRVYSVPFIDEVVQEVVIREKKIIVNKAKYNEVKLCE